jgi:hypothetical protein
MFDDADVISAYPLEQAIEDGILTEVLKTGGKPVVATAAISEEFSLGEILEIWHQYIHWRQKVLPTLPEEEQLFVTQRHDKKIWVLEDGVAFTILYPSDY